MANNKENSQVNLSRKEYRERGRGRKILGTVALIAGVLLLFTLLDGYGSQRGRWFHGDRHGAELSLKEWQERTNKGAEWVLDHVDASEEQKAQVKVILDDLASEVATLQGERAALVENFKQALEEDAIGQDELEPLRTASVRLAERAIGLTTDGLLAIVEILTPEQRRQLVKAWKEHR